MCGIFGTTIKDLSLLYFLGVESTLRGTDATGLAWLRDNGELKVEKAPVAATQFNWKNVPEKGVLGYIGHTRAATQGPASFNGNNHPFKSEDGSFVLVHNGIIYNDFKLKRELALPSTDIMTDSYVIVQLLDAYKYLMNKDDLDVEVIKQVCPELSGSYALAIMTNKGKLFLTRHDNPIHIIYNGKDLVFGSTHDIVDAALGNYGLNEISYMSAPITMLPENKIYEFDMLTGKFIAVAEYVPNKDNYNYLGYGTYSGYGWYDDDYWVNDVRGKNKGKDKKGVVFIPETKGGANQTGKSQTTKNTTKDTPDDRKLLPGDGIHQKMEAINDHVVFVGYDDEYLYYLVDGFVLPNGMRIRYSAFYPDKAFIVDFGDGIEHDVAPELLESWTGVDCGYVRDVFNDPASCGVELKQYSVMIPMAHDETDASSVPVSREEVEEFMYKACKDKMQAKTKNNKEEKVCRK